MTPKLQTLSEYFVNELKNEQENILKQMEELMIQCLLDNREQIENSREDDSFTVTIPIEYNLTYKAQQ